MPIFYILSDLCNKGLVYCTKDTKLIGIFRICDRSFLLTVYCIDDNFELCHRLFLKTCIIKTFKCISIGLNQQLKHNHAIASNQTRRITTTTTTTQWSTCKTFLLTRISDNRHEFGARTSCVGHDVNATTAGGWLRWSGLTLITNLSVITHESYWTYAKCFTSWPFFLFYNISAGFS